MSIIGGDLEAMYAVAEDDELPTLDRLAERAGLRWTCPVRPWTNLPGEPCDDCGRTEADARAYRAAIDAGAPLPIGRSDRLAGLAKL